MHLKRWNITAAAVMVVVTLLAACGFFSCHRKEAASGLTVGFAAMNVEMTWMKFAYEAIYRRASDLGVELVTYDANNELNKQINCIDHLIREGVDAILTNPIDVTALNPVLKKAFEHNIPVVTFDRSAPAAPVLFFVGSDDVEAGRIACRFIAEKLNGEAAIVMLEGALDSSPALNRTKGFLEELKNYPGMGVVFRKNAGFFRDRGYQVMEEALSILSGFDAVYAQNDEMMLGAVEAMENAGILPGQVVTVGNDAIPEALRAIESGRMDATIQYPIRQAELAVEQLALYLKTKQLPEWETFLVTPWLITPDNLTSGDFYALIHPYTDEAGVLAPEDTDDTGDSSPGGENALEK